MSKILQIIHVPGLLAVIGDKEGFYTVKVSHIRLVEDFQQGSNGNHEIEVREVPVIPWRGKLTCCDEVPNFLGIAGSQNEANGIGYRAMSREAFQKVIDETKSNQKRSFDWGRCSRPAKVESIQQCAN